MFPSILIVDDEPSILQSLQGLLSDEGFEVITASNGYEAIKTIESESPDLILLDIWMPGIDGIETLKEIKKEHPFIPVVMITGHGTIETAVSATRFGAFDFIEKPLSIDKVIVTINNALNFRRLEEENKYLRAKTIAKYSLDGASHPVIELNQQISAAAPTDAGILISGENGTGKELVARTIHNFSPRVEEPFITVSCGAVPEEQLDSELFGHEKGSFPAATSKNRGKFELATSGTIFLDEIGDLSLKNQAKILQVLQEKKFKRVGGNRTITVDVRIIASTNKNLEEEIKKGTFREDLYFRINVIPINVPSLRERAQDLPLLFATFMEECCAKSSGAPKEITPEALELLSEYHWPGNVRELKNLVERLSIMVTDDTIDLAHIPAHFKTQESSPVPTKLTSLLSINNLKDAKANFEKEFIKMKFKENSNDFNKTAEAIGITVTELKSVLG